MCGVCRCFWVFISVLFFFYIFIYILINYFFPLLFSRVYRDNIYSAWGGAGGNQVGKKAHVGYSVSVSPRSLGNLCVWTE